MDDHADARRPAADRDRIGLAVIVLGALAWAGYGIGRKPFWLDESLSVGATTQLATTWRQTGGTMGAYYALLTGWSQVSLDRVWLRALSLALALAVLPVVHRLGRLVGGVAVARVATALTAGSWFFVRYAQEARSYALALLLTTVGWLALVEWVRSPADSREARRWSTVFAATAVLAVLSHGLTGLQLLAQLTALALLPDRRTRLRAMAPAAGAAFLALALLTVFGAAEVANWVPPLSLDQLHDLLAAFTGPSVVAQLALGAAAVAGAVAAVAAHRRAPASFDGWLRGVVVVWALLPPLALVALSALRPYLLPRYVLGSVPGIALLVALALEPLRHRRVAGAVALVALAGVLLAGRITLADEASADWAGTAELVADGARPGDVVAFPTQTVRQPFDFAWGELDDPAVTPSVVSPVGPLGEVHRFYRFYADDEVPGRLAELDPARIWVVSTETVAQGDLLTPFLAVPELDAYREVERRRFDGDLTVVLLERR